MGRARPPAQLVNPRKPVGISLAGERTDQDQSLPVTHWYYASRSNRSFRHLRVYGRYGRGSLCHARKSTVIYLRESVDGHESIAAWSSFRKGILDVQTTLGMGRY